ncbi:MAG: HAMP domain-containing protein [Candidatus Omnitrophica bacterium]|nr:HAMP domain-containing protein [Candidatus Omnitrophota bacterium]
MRSNSLRFEISILHTAILGVILVVFSSVLYFISRASFQQIDQQLKVKAEAVDTSIRTYLNAFGDDPGALAKSVQKTFAMKEEGPFAIKLRKISADWVRQSLALSLNKATLTFFDRQKKDVTSTPDLDKGLLDVFLEYTRIPKGETMAFRTVTYNHKRLRVITYPFGRDPAGEYFIQVGITEDPIMQQLLNWLYSILISLPLILLLTGFVGRRQAARILAPVNEITQMANKITHQDLSARITAKHFDREMGSLIDSFNDMIARLERSFRHIEEFSYHVAHELKTPLTIIKGEADLLLRRERSKEEYQEALRIVLEESQRMLKTIEDLLLLTKLDYSPEVLKFETFNFVEFFNEICEQSRILASKKLITVTLETQGTIAPLVMKGDKLHLRRLFFNIIDNAVKFTPEGGSIDIKITTGEDKIITSISDTGEGISPENLSKIFDKFFRSQNACGGNGLGLSIAATIAKLHKGEISAESCVSQGTTFKIILPSEPAETLPA